ncbi:MAG: carbamoyl-phosphate synthase large subunit [Legionellales bacterium]|nr:carbamoyl-phosphate synthase large subunit [Legionellales bacterium]
MKRTNIQSILILGAGPIIIGQACEFDYSGVQACKTLKAEGYRVILINSNPATIMTDPELADATYIEPITPEVVERIIALEKPDALLPTMGGQTALNCALKLAQQGILALHQVELIGASQLAIEKAEDRGLFCLAMQRIGLEVARSIVVYTLEEAIAAQKQFGFPVVIRPSYTLGGSGGGIAYHFDEFQAICERGLELSANHELLIEESILGWKEFELEVVRDKNDNAIIVCSIENFDAMGIHTGDSITVAPAQTLTDKEYQAMRNAAIAVLREIGVETGGANVQFAIEPHTGRMLVIEMNPRVSRSSALASKATGFPIAKVAAKLAVGYTLDEIRHDMTYSSIPFSFEPSIDYTVVKLPRFHFEKFPEADASLTTQMKSVGEVMALGENFQQALQKAILSLETGFSGFEPQLDLAQPNASETIRAALQNPGADRLFYLGDAFRLGLSVEQIHHLSYIDPWFLRQIEEIISIENQLLTMEKIDWLALKKVGFSDRRLSQLLNTSEELIRETRLSYHIKPTYQRVDSCAAEFAVSTAYMYSTYQNTCEARVENKPKIVIIGSGPNRIGQGIEFDYGCVHAVYAVREAGYQSIMINCNPETVSTDYDTTDRLYFEPLSFEHVSSILESEQPDGVILQLGGQTPLKLAHAIQKAGFKILGTKPEHIDIAEDRAQFSALIQDLGLRQPNCMAITNLEEGIIAANQLQYPLLVRPSFVLGGSAMKIVYDAETLEHYLVHVLNIVSNSPILIDQFLDNAIEVDVDAICDGKTVLITGLMEHIEPAGVHSGDSACSLPPFNLSESVQQALCQQVTQLAFAIGVIGLMNVQFAIQDKQIYVLEVNPRASRTMPFVAKATGVQLIKLATHVMLGEKLPDLFVRFSIPVEKCHDSFKLKTRGIAIKLPVFPFAKFAGVDPLLGPEMKSTGEVMGWANNFGEAFGKAMLAAGIALPKPGNVILSVRDEDKLMLKSLANDLIALGFTLTCTFGTGRALSEWGIPFTLIAKVHEGRPNVLDLIKNQLVTFVVNTASGNTTIADSSTVRIATLHQRICYAATIAGAKAIVEALKSGEQHIPIVLQEAAFHF